MLDWNDLKLVIAIAEAGTLSGATRLVAASQPTISRRLAELETTLGFKLFVRRPDGYFLTLAGEKVHARALQMEFNARQIERDIVDDASPEGHIVMTTTEDFAIYCVTPLIKQFHSQFPRITIDMVISYESVDVLRRVADIAVRVGNPRKHDLEQQHIGQVHFSIFGSEEYLEKNGEPKDLEDLKQHSIVGSSGGIANFMQTRMLYELTNEAPMNFITDNLMNQLSAVKAGVGLMALPSYLASDAPELKRVLTDQFDPCLDVWMLTNKDIVRAERIRSLVDFLVEGIGQRLTDLAK